MSALCLPETTGHSQNFGVLYKSISQSEPEIQALKVNIVTASSVEWNIQLIRHNSALRSFNAKTIEISKQPGG